MLFTNFTIVIIVGCHFKSIEALMAGLLEAVAGDRTGGELLADAPDGATLGEIYEGD
jgi:hypothetical protein